MLPNFIKLLTLMSLIFLFAPQYLCGLDNLEITPFKLKEKKINPQNKDPLKTSQVQNLRDDIHFDDKTTGFRIGLKGGLQITNGEVDNINNTTSKTTFPYGLALDYQFSPYLSIGINILMMEKGVTINDNSGVTFDIAFRYIGFIPDIKYYPFKKYFYILAGPSFYYNIDNEITPDLINAGSDFGKSFAFGMNAGIGLFYDIASFRIALEGRYDFGFTNIFDTSKIGDASIKFRDIQLFFGVSYKL